MAGMGENGKCRQGNAAGGGALRVPGERNVLPCRDAEYRRCGGEYDAAEGGVERDTDAAA